MKLRFDLFPELIDKFQDAYLQVAVEEVVVTLEESDNKVFSQEVVESFLPNGAVAYLLGLESVLQTVCYFERAAVESDAYFEVIFEEVVSSIEVELHEFQFIDFGVEVAREVEVAQFKGVECVSFLVDSYFQLQFKFADEFVRDVLFSGTVVEQFGEHRLELHTPFLFQKLQIFLQTKLELGERLGAFSLCKAFPKIDGILALHTLTPDGTDQG